MGDDRNDDNGREMGMWKVHHKINEVKGKRREGMKNKQLSQTKNMSKGHGTLDALGVEPQGTKNGLEKQPSNVATR